ncbi:MAG: two-component regulator propeller domain-containing protein [Bacteroidota bacterium]
MPSYKTKYFIFSTVLFINCLFVSAQDEDSYLFGKITTENINLKKGLSQNSVFSIFQDHIGYMWFGTWDGLNMYDGYSFTVFTENENGLSNQTINAIYEDIRGTIWVGTDAGLNKYNRKNRTFKSYRPNNFMPSSISSDTITCIFQDSRENYWIGTKDGLNKFDPDNEVFFKYKVDQDINNNEIYYDIAEDKDGKIWLASNTGIKIYNPASNSFFCYWDNSGGKNNLISKKIWSVEIDSSGLVWIGSDKGLSCYNIVTQKFRHFLSCPENPDSLSYNDVYDIIESYDGMIWIATYGGGLNRYNKKTNKFDRFSSYRSENDVFINTVYEDKSGIIWFGTYTKGAGYINLNSKRFNHFHMNAESKTQRISNNIVWSIFEDKNSKLWIATDFGIEIIDRKSRTAEYLRNIAKSSNSLPGNMVRDIFIDSEGIVWIGTFDKGLCTYNTESGIFKYFPVDVEDNKGISSNLVWCINEDKYGQIWVGTNYGLNKYDKKTDTFTKYFNQHDNGATISSNEIYGIYTDNINNLWICTNYGLNRYNYSKNSFSVEPDMQSDSKGLNSNKIFTIYQDKENIYWIGTVGGGLNRFDPKNNSYKYYVEKEGLTNKVVYAIFEDDHNNLWMSTNGGIFKFDKIREIFYNYDVLDGVQSNEFNLGSAFQSKSGEMFFGGMTGFNTFFPDEILQNEFLPNIVITDFNIFNKSLQRSLRHNDTIWLSHKDNFFSFEFSSLDFISPQKNKYAYKMSGIDKDWVFCDANHRFAEYTNIQPGRYVFTVKGSNSSGIWNETGTSLIIIVEPPWWQTFYFLIPFGFFIGLIIWYIIYIELKRIRKKQEYQKQLLDLERKALRLQMNPHFIFNTLNSIQFFILKNDKLASNKYLTMFSKLMRLVLNNSQYSTIPVKDDLETLKLYIELEQLRFDNSFQYSIEIEDDEDIIWDCKIPAMIIQPYVENAIIHGLRNREDNKGILNIMMKSEGEFINCIIEDNGVGRNKAMEIRQMSGQKHKPMGKEITKTRLELISSMKGHQLFLNVIDLKDKENKPIGTRIEIKIPVFD